MPFQVSKVGGRGGRTANLKGLRGLAWGLRRARASRSPCGLQNSESPHVDPRLLRLRGAGSTQVKPSVLPGHPSIHPHAGLFLPSPCPQCLSFPLRTGVRSRSPHFPDSGPLGSRRRWGPAGEVERARVCEPSCWACARAGGGRPAACGECDPAGCSRRCRYAPVPVQMRPWPACLRLAPAGSGEEAPPPPHLLGPLFPPPAAPTRPRDTPQVHEWFGPQPHQCLFCKSGFHSL